LVAVAPLVQYCVHTAWMALRSAASCSAAEVEEMAGEVFATELLLLVVQSGEEGSAGPLVGDVLAGDEVLAVARADVELAMAGVREGRV
jgi:hypothetical protein